MSCTFKGNCMRVIGVISGLVLMPTVCLTAYTVEKKLSKNIINEFYPASITIAVRENNAEELSPTSNNSITWSKQDNTTEYTAVKKIEIKNLDVPNQTNANAYIRVCIIPKWISQITIGDGDESKTVDFDVANFSGLSNFNQLTSIKITDATYKMGDVTFKLNANWSDDWIFNPNDGYFYYKKIVKPNMETSTLLESVSIPEKIYKLIDKQGIQLEVDVLADAIQTQKSLSDVDALNDSSSGRWKDSGIVIDGDTRELKIKSS